MRCADLVADERGEKRLDKLAAAIEEVRRVQPRQYSQLQRYLQRVLIIPAGGQLYDFSIRACVLDVQFVEHSVLILLASVLVHESVHARLNKMGVRHLSADMPRIEQLTIDVQAEFLNAAGRTDLVHAIQVAARTDWWTEQAMVKRRVEQLKGYGAPRWLMRLYRRALGEG